MLRSCLPPMQVRSMVDYSFGIIPMRKMGHVWEVFIVQHRHGKHWSFPKGHAEEDEKPIDAACRELYEETGLSIGSLLTSEPFVEKYQFFAQGKKIYKTVSYFLVLVEGTCNLQTAEITGGKWVPLNEAPDHLSHPQAKALSKQALSFLMEHYNARY